MHISSKLCSKPGSFPLLIAMAVFAVLAITAEASAQKIITYNVPGAGTGAGQGTQAFGINRSGTVAGFYVDTSNVSHGFVRKPNGDFNTFDPAGSTSTFVIAINQKGAIVGWYYDVSNVIHGFLRVPDGAITTFDAPLAGTGANQGTIAGDINDLGVIAGYYVDATNVAQGFLLNPAGKFTTFDAPGAGIGAGQGTFPQFFSCLTDFRASTGYYIDPGNVNHGFVLNPDGKVSTFEAPNAGTGAGQGTLGESINLKGESVGYFVDEKNVDHGYVRAPDGTLTTFDVRDAGTGAGQGTYSMTNNLEGAISGFYIDANSAYHGFLRLPNKSSWHGSGQDLP
jgi:hypothetical protein